MNILGYVCHIQTTKRPIVQSCFLCVYIKAQECGDGGVPVSVFVSHIWPPQEYIKSLHMGTLRMVTESGFAFFNSFRLFIFVNKLSTTNCDKEYLYDLLEEDISFFSFPLNLYCERFVRFQCFFSMQVDLPLLSMQKFVDVLKILFMRPPNILSFYPYLFRNCNQSRFSLILFIHIHFANLEFRFGQSSGIFHMNITCEIAD